MSILFDFPRFSKKSYTLCSELSWSHLRLIMRLPAAEVREYYIEQSKNGNWSVCDLEKAIVDHKEKFMLEMGRGFSYVE